LTPQQIFRKGYCALSLLASKGGGMPGFSITGLSITGLSIAGLSIAGLSSTADSIPGCSSGQNAQSNGWPE
jgi:hypothetical protein